MKVATIQQKNTCQESLFFQNEETSSMANRSPPTGAPNAEAMPAAAPAEIKFLLSSEFLNLEKNGSVHSKVAARIHSYIFLLTVFFPDEIRCSV